MTTEGALLGQRYALGRTLGIGGMAEVFLAEDTRLGREVAVKVLRADLARDPSFHQRFRQEAQAAASLTAPTIVSVYDTGEDVVDGSRVPWIVMEHVEGRTLREVLTAEGRLLPQRALEVTADICSALQVAHEAGIVHRDVKPGNVMLLRSGEVKVMDFGIASAAAGGSATVTQAGGVTGTAAYLSPEQARGEHVDARSDVYSTGCLLYELITGSVPFTGDSPVAVAYQHVREDPVPPSDWDPSLTADIDAVVLKAMAKNPAARYATAGAMSEDLLRAAAGMPVAAPAVLPVGTVLPEQGRPRDAKRQKRAIAYGLFAVVLLGVALAVGLIVKNVLSDPSSLVGAPDVVGRSQQQAETVLARSGLVMRVLDQKFDEAPLGTVLAQSPVSQIMLPVGGVVDVTLSFGPEQTIVPTVVGLQQRDATGLLTGSKLSVSQIVPRDGNFRPGQVLEVLPPAGTNLPADGAVQLVVATGQVDVPVTIGKTQQQAEAALRGQFFNVGVKLRADPGPPGVVLDQAPLAGKATRQTTVVITVSELPPPPPPPSPEPTPTPSPSPSPSPTASASPGPSGSPQPSRSPSRSPSPPPVRPSPTPVRPSPPAA